MMTACAAAYLATVIFISANNTSIWIHTSLFMDKVSWLYARVI